MATLTEPQLSFLRSRPGQTMDRRAHKVVPAFISLRLTARLRVRARFRQVRLVGEDQANDLQISRWEIHLRTWEVRSPDMRPNFRPPKARDHRKDHRKDPHTAVCHRALRQAVLHKDLHGRVLRLCLT